MAQHKTLRIFGAGGFGVNIARHYQPTSPDIADAPLVAYLDTSKSNLKGDNEAFSYLIEGIDGSGKKRDLNVESIRRHITPALTKFPAGDFNLVLFSGSGGSGSVFGPLLVDELLSRKKQVIVMLLGDSDSAIATNNTLNTIKTLSALSAKHGTAVTIVYEEMAHGSQRRQVDDMFHEAIKAIRGLTSGLVDEIDTMDIGNWLAYEKVTSHQPGLSLLNIYTANERLNDLYEALSVASLYSSKDEPHGVVKAAYRTTGYTNNQGTQPTHFVITQSGLHAIAEALKRKVDEYKDQAAHVASQHVSLHEPGTGSDFMVL